MVALARAVAKSPWPVDARVLCPLGRGEVRRPAVSRDRADERFDVVVLDELGYVPFDMLGADLLFSFITKIYERLSLIVTTNLPFARWSEVLPRRGGSRRRDRSHCAPCDDPTDRGQELQTP